VACWLIEFIYGKIFNEYLYKKLNMKLLNIVPKLI